MRVSTIIDNKEKRVAITPEMVKKYISIGLEVVLPKNSGVSAGFSDNEYIDSGAKIEDVTLVDADLYLCVRPSFDTELHLKEGAFLIASLAPFKNYEVLHKLAESGVNLCALEKIPRITRAQSMDILSSQANIAGYRAAIVAMSMYGRVIPLMMTAAGTIRPAKALIVGAGVAGLQAIATMKRLGAVVNAFDVRAAAKEQVESLGANFIAVENDDNGESAGGYAKEMSEDYKRRQAEKLAEVIAKTDIVITTAQIPNKPAPRLITRSMVQSMMSGSVIVDMATETGGNCEVSKMDAVEYVDGVTIIGYTDFAAQVAYDSSQLFARNMFNFVSLLVKDGKIDTSDEIIQAVLVR